MGDIPEDVRREAERLWTEQPFESTKGIIARAILAERSRCAAVAEAYGSDVDPDVGDWIAERIRKGEPA